MFKQLHTNLFSLFLTIGLIAILCNPVLPSAGNRSDCNEVGAGQC